MRKSNLQKIIICIVISICSICLFTMPAFAANYRYCPVCHETIDWDNRTAIGVHSKNCSGAPKAITEEFKEKLDSGTASEEDLDKYSVLARNSFFVSMINDIFSLEDANLSSGSELFDTKTVMISFANITIQAITNWGSSPIYSFFLGIGLFILVINFIVNFYNNRMNSEGKTIEQYSRLFFGLLVGIFIVANVNKIVLGLLNLFIFVMEKAWTFMEDPLNPLKTQVRAEESTIIFSDAEDIAYTLLVSVHADESTNISNIINGGAFSAFMLVFKFFLPWIICVIGKFGILFEVIKNSLMIVVNCMLYPIAAGDCSENIKTSKFMKYTKHIIASVLNLTIIVIVLMGAQFLTSNYAIKLIEQAKAKNVDNMFNIAIIAAVIQLSKTVVIMSSANLASKVIGE